MEKVFVQETHLLKDTARIDSKQIMELWGHTELVPFEAGVYKDGPTIFALTPSQFEDEKQDYEIYIPINHEAESTDELTYIPELQIKGLRKRALFAEGLDVHLQEMKDYFKENHLTLPDKLYLVMIPIFEDMFVDMIIPTED